MSDGADPETLAEIEAALKALSEADPAPDPLRALERLRKMDAYVDRPDHLHTASAVTRAYGRVRPEARAILRQALQAQVDLMPVVVTPFCPGCDALPQMMLSTTQAFCGDDECRVVMWNMTPTPQVDPVAGVALAQRPKPHRPVSRRNAEERQALEMFRDRWHELGARCGIGGCARCGTE